MVLLPRRMVFLVRLLTWILRQYQHKNSSEKKWFYEVHSKEPTFSEITELRFKFNVSSIFFFIYLRERDADMNHEILETHNFFCSTAGIQIFRAYQSYKSQCQSALAQTVVCTAMVVCDQQHSNQ